MARFELSLSNGEKILVDHGAEDMPALMEELAGKDFVLLAEVMGVGAPSRDLIVASGQISLIRLLADRSAQGSNFRPKR